MLSLRQVAFAALLACATPVAFAAPQNLGQAVEQSILRNPDILSRFHNFQSLQAEQDAIRGGLRPRVDVQAFAGRERSSFNGGPTNSYNRPGASIQLRQLLFDGNGVRSDARRAGYSKLSRYYELLNASDEIALETVRAYLDVQRYRALELLARDNWAFHNETMQQLERRARAGVGRRVDLELAVGRSALAQSNWLTDTSNLHDVSQRYQRLVGDAPLPVLAEVPAAIGLPTEQDVLVEATRRNPSFLGAVATIRASRAEMDTRRAANSPTVELRASTGRDRSLIAANTTGSNNNSAVQLLLNYNLYRGGSDAALVRQAQEQLYAAQDARDNACRNIRQQTSIAYNDTRRLREQLGYLEQHQLSSEKAREAYRQQFDIGQRSLLDLLDTENELFQARRAVVNARHDQLLAGYRVLAQTNSILTAVNLQPLARTAPEEASESNPAEDEAVRCSTELPAATTLDTAAAMAARPPLPATSYVLPASRSTPENLPAAMQAAPAAPAQRAPAAGGLPAAAPASTSAPALESTVQSWASAWSAKNLDAYLGYYASNFQPQQGNLAAWKAQRTQRVQKTGDIRVAVEQLAVRSIDADTAEASFVQRYQSDSLNESVRKTLVFVRQGGGWKIQREMAQPIR